MAANLVAQPFGLVAMVLLGLGLGLRHAFDPDHLAAVAATVARHDARRATRVGALWGIGHAATILLLGGMLVGAGLTLPPYLAALAELGVGLMLVLLGADLLLAWRRERIHLHAHEHDGLRHLHAHGHGRGPGHDHPHPERRALLVGMTHGLAGSGALAVLVAAATPSRARGLLFLLLFGAGAALAMTLVTAAASLPLRLASERPRPGLARALSAASAAISIGVGGMLAATACRALAGGG